MSSSGIKNKLEGTVHKDSGHRKRLRDRFLQSGLGGLHDYEIIELLLTLGTPLKDCKPMAKAAITEFFEFLFVFVIAVSSFVAKLCSTQGEFSSKMSKRVENENVKEDGRSII